MICAAATFEDRKDAAKVRNRLRENFRLLSTTRYCENCFCYHLNVSPRECGSKEQQRIIELVARGYTDADIALELNVNRRRVSDTVKKLIARWYLRNRVQLALFAIVMGIVDPNDYLPPITEAKHG
jgi:DNA-binding NarL/FixJ family response regulator